MNAGWRGGLLIALLFAGGWSARASDDEVAVGRAARLLEEISSDPRSGIPQEDLRQAVGILIVPRIVETRVGLGRKRGHGVFLSRDAKGQWGHPEPFDISGVSAGAEAAHEVTDLVILFRTPKAVEEYSELPGKFFIYAGANVAIRDKKHLFHRHPDRKHDEQYRIYMRHHGFWVGSGLSVERRKSPALTPAPASADTKSATV